MENNGDYFLESRYKKENFPTDGAKLMSANLVSRLSQMDPTPVQVVGSIPPTWSSVWCLPQRLRRSS